LSPDIARKLIKGSEDWDASLVSKKTWFKNLAHLVGAQDLIKEA